MLNTVLKPDYDRYDPMQRQKFESGKPLFEENYPLNKALCEMSPNIAAELMNYARGKGPDIISLAQGEGCMPTPDFIVDAAAKALKEGKTFYGRPLGLPELREEISEYYKRIYGLNDIGPERVFISTSGSNAMNLTLRALLNKGDEVVAITPIWKNLLGAVELSDAKVRQVGLTEGPQGWSLDLDKLFAACTEKTKALLIVSPSNPTGWIISPEEIERILAFARERNIWVISDEVYSRLVYEGARAVSFLDYAKPDDLLMVINSFSKTWAMTGWRLGWIVGPAFMDDKIRHISIYNNLCVAPFTQYAGIAALREGEEFIRNQLNLWRRTRELLMDTLGQHPRVKLTRPESSFYAFFRVDGEPDCIDFCYRLIDEAGVSLAPGITFGDCSKSYIRMSFACSRSKMEKALERLVKVL